MGIAGDAGREIGGQRDGFVERVGVQALGVAQGGGHGLDAGTGDVIKRILFGERPTRSLRVRAQRHGLGVLGVELLDHLGPQQTTGTHLGDLHEQVFTLRPEEGETGSEGVDIDAGLDAGAQVFETVGQGVGQLQVGGGTRLLHVVTRDRDGVKLGHFLRGELEDVCDDPHRGQRRINVGVAHHVFLQDVVLDRARELVQFHALLKGGDDVERQHRKHGTVHRHGNADTVERDAGEERLHIDDRIDGDTGLAHVTDHAGVIAVVAAVGGQVEGD